MENQTFPVTARLIRSNVKKQLETGLVFEIDWAEYAEASSTDPFMRILSERNLQYSKISLIAPDSHQPGDAYVRKLRVGMMTFGSEDKCDAAYAYLTDRLSEWMKNGKRVAVDEPA